RARARGRPETRIAGGEVPGRTERWHRRTVEHDLVLPGNEIGNAVGVRASRRFAKVEAVSAGAAGERVVAGCAAQDVGRAVADDDVRDVVAGAVDRRGAGQREL